MRLKLISEYKKGDKHTTKSGTHWVELVGRNGKIIMYSEDYYDFPTALASVKRLSAQLNLPWKRQERDW